MEGQITAQQAGGPAAIDAAQKDSVKHPDLHMARSAELPDEEA
jgi:hypothetical protein